MGDRGAHVGTPEFGQQRAVGVLHHRVHGALWVDHHLDSLRRQTEQPARLDDLEALVHHRRRVDRDLSSHDPVRVCAGLVRGHRGERLERGVTERPTGGGQQQLAHAAAVEAAREASGQALEDGVVLRIDRQQLGTTGRDGIHEQPPGHHQRLLVGEQDAPTGTRRGQRRQQARRADDGRDHDLGPVDCRGGNQAIHAGEDLGRTLRGDQLTGQLGRGAGVGHRRHAWPQANAQRGHAGHVAVGGQRLDLVTLGVALQHIERAGADRAGRTEQCHALHAPLPSQAMPTAKNGAAAVRLSTRSSTPP
jgi:hypothetical protein